ELLPRGLELGEHRGVHRVGRIGPGEHQPADGTVAPDLERLLGHDARPVRSAPRRILPTSVRGISSTRRNATGTLYGTRCSRHNATSASSATSSSVTTYATGTSPRRSSGSPTTPASRTDGWRSRTSSTA